MITAISTFEFTSKTVQNSKVWVNFQQGRFLTCQCHQFWQKVFKLFKKDPRYKFYEFWSQFSTLRVYFWVNIQSWKLPPQSIFNAGQYSSLHQLISFVSHNVSSWQRQSYLSLKRFTPVKQNLGIIFYVIGCEGDLLIKIHFFSLDIYIFYNVFMPLK